jgi:hypothetical protein
LVDREKLDQQPAIWKHKVPRRFPDRRRIAGGHPDRIGRREGRAGKEAELILQRLPGVVCVPLPHHAGLQVGLAGMSIREGMPSLIVLNEDAVPSIYWQPSEPRLKRQELANELKQDAEIEGVALSDPEPVLSVRTR